MKAIKTLLAVSVLAAAGAANAATVATFSVDITGNVNQAPATGTLVGTGTASLDDAGILTINSHNTTTLSLFGGTNVTTIDAQTVVSGGALTGNSLSWTSAVSTLSNCQPVSGSAAAYICGQVPPTQAANIDQKPILFNLAAVGAQTIITSDAADPTKLNTYTLTATSVPSAVPVPAAAWLFGSGLLGLAGTARRRAKQA